jgi:O-succinylbenzoate synthase
MKISRVVLNLLRMPLISPFETSFGSITSRDCILLEAYGEGLVGYGECVADRDPGYSYETSKTAWHILKEFLIPAVLNRDIHHVDELQECLSPVRGHPMAKAGLELAFWDLVGKQQEYSLRELLGGISQQVEVGVSVGIQDSPNKLISVVEGYLRQGYRRIKIKIKPGRDIRETQVVRQAFPHLRLQVDANSAYTIANSYSLKPLDGLNLLLIEQPLAEDDLWDHSRMQTQFDTPICLDESILSPRHARQALEMKACRVINIKSGRVGGLSRAVAIHDLCRSQDIPVWCGGMLETGVGRAANLALASLPGFILPGDISASDRYYREDITEERFMLNSDSTITVPDGAGLGVHINRKSVAKYTVQQMDIS